MNYSAPLVNIKVSDVSEPVTLSIKTQCISKTESSV